MNGKSPHPFDFLRARVAELARELGPPSGESFLKTWDSLLTQTASRDPDAAPTTLEKIEREIDLFPRSSLGRKAIDSVEKRLEKTFGFRSLAENPEIVIAKVLRRKLIRNEEECRIVRDFLADGTPLESVTEEKAKKLDGYMSAFEKIR